MNPKNNQEIARKEKKAALQYLIFLKQKRCGKIKRRGCADRRKKRDYLTKNDTKTPIVVEKALFLMYLIDDFDHQHAATVDITGDFMQLDKEGDMVHMKIDNIIVDILTKLYPKMNQKFI